MNNYYTEAEVEKSIEQFEDEPKPCTIFDCEYYDSVEYRSCLKFTKIEQCHAIQLVNNREHRIGMLRHIIKELKDGKTT